MPLGGCKGWHPELEIGKGVRNLPLSRMSLERATVQGDSPVGERGKAPANFLSTTGHEEPCGKLGRPLSKAKYSWRPIVNQYREGKVKSTPGGE